MILTKVFVSVDSFNRNYYIHHQIEQKMTKKMIKRQVRSHKERNGERWQFV